ncbi:hypothetical protein E5Q_04885 [Mixia osmundae IAM 14324]|uniref:Uncharacterized protein n=1 Tax=Mixia osmundae (strain CBS 9802 / IAM 14324 / JCM 22182 / KY 12970) TaxID=764103 RepID=G7E5U2_MIXOS|nr:hypothetical protein E5Q_04885 [Mixia osmundae IAM 14324]
MTLDEQQASSRKKPRLESMSSGFSIRGRATSASKPAPAVKPEPTPPPPPEELDEEPSDDDDDDEAVISLGGTPEAERKPHGHPPTTTITSLPVETTKKQPDDTLDAKKKTETPSRPLADESMQDATVKPDLHSPDYDDQIRIGKLEEQLEASKKDNLALAMELARMTGFLQSIESGDEFQLDYGLPSAPTYCGTATVPLPVAFMYRSLQEQVKMLNKDNQRLKDERDAALWQADTRQSRPLGSDARRIVDLLSVLRRENDELGEALAIGPMTTLRSANEHLERQVKMRDDALKESHALLQALDDEVNELYGIKRYGAPAPPTSKAPKESSRSEPRSPNHHQRRAADRLEPLSSERDRKAGSARPPSSPRRDDAYSSRSDGRRSRHEETGRDDSHSSRKHEPRRSNALGDDRRDTRVDGDRHARRGSSPREGRPDLQHAS